MNSIFKKTCVFEVDYFDLEAFLNDKFGRHMVFIAEEEWNNDSQHVIAVDGKLDEWDRKHLKEFAGFGIIRILLNRLCEHGDIEPGDYLINVSW